MRVAVFSTRPYDEQYLAAAERLGLAVLRVPKYSPHAVAELATVTIDNVSAFEHDDELLDLVSSRT